MANPKIAPAEFDEYSARLLDSVKEAQQLPADNESESTRNLTRLIEMANEMKRDADERSDLWKKFRELRDQVSDKQDAVQQAHDELKKGPLVPASELNKRVKDIEVCFFYSGL